MAYWVLVKKGAGRLGLLGPYLLMGKAQEVVDARDDGFDCEVVKLETCDPTKATRILKARRIEGEGLELGVKNFRHKEV